MAALPSTGQDGGSASPAEPAALPSVPSGTVTFLFTDIEGSTRLLEQLREQYAAVLADQRDLLRAAFAAHHGLEIDTQGDAFFAAFPRALDAIGCVVAAQRALAGHAWPQGAAVRVRMGLHTGEPIVGRTGYVGMDVHRAARIAGAGHGGQVLLSQTTRDLVYQDLPVGLSLRPLGEHQLKDIRFPQTLYQLDIDGLPVEFPALRTGRAAPRHNLPLQLTSFIGRQKEILEVKRLLSARRLVTLTGSGGIGKTRLALQVAVELLPWFAEGVWWIELAPLADPGLVAQAVAAALGLRVEGNRPVLEALAEHLRERTALLVLDNCEHVVQDCARLAETLLSTCPDLRILASTREALRIKGETTFHVPSLSLPDRRGNASAALVTSEAARLFVERAVAVSRDFQLTDDNAPAVVDVCRRLDGIPLAIELAAARVNVLSVEQIAARLSDCFRLLTSGSRTALPRHQTLRAMLDWSHDLLEEDERILLRRLSVFAGGWALEAAETVCGWNGPASDDVLDSLTRLVDKSLVVAESQLGSDTRYRLLDSVRQYAREWLSAAGEMGAARDRHLSYFTRVAEDSELELVRTNQLAWLQRLEADFDNIRAALGWAQENAIAAPAGPGVEQGLRLASAIWRFCLRQGYASELAEKLSGLLTQPAATARTSLRVKALIAISTLSIWQTDIARARRMAEQGLEIAAELGDQHGQAASLYALGTAAMMEDDPAWHSLFLKSVALYRTLQDSLGLSEALILWGSYVMNTDPRQAQSYLEEALVLSRERGDVISMAGALDNLGTLALGLGDLPRARVWLEESLVLQRPLGAPGYVTTLKCLGDLALYEGNPVQARAYLEEALVMSKNAGLTNIFLLTLLALGYVALQEGHWDEAGASFGKALVQFASAGRKYRVVSAVEGLASTAAQQRQPERAARLFAWSAAARMANELSLLPIEQPVVDRHLALARAQLDGTAFEALWAEGQAMTLEHATAYALKNQAAASPPCSPMPG